MRIWIVHRYWHLAAIKGHRWRFTYFSLSPLLCSFSWLHSKTELTPLLGLAEHSVSCLFCLSCNFRTAGGTAGGLRLNNDTTISIYIHLQHLHFGLFFVEFFGNTSRHEISWTYDSLNVGFCITKCPVSMSTVPFSATLIYPFSSDVTVPSVSPSLVWCSVTLITVIWGNMR